LALLLRVAAPFMGGGSVVWLRQTYPGRLLDLLDPTLIFFAMLARLYITYTTDGWRRAEYLQGLAAMPRHKLAALEENDAHLQQQLDALQGTLAAMREELVALRVHFQTSVSTVSRLRRHSELSVTELQERLAAAEAELARAIRRPPPISLWRLCFAWEWPRTKLKSLLWYLAGSLADTDAPTPPTTHS
jgi:hypothetical protein